MISRKSQNKIAVSSASAYWTHTKQEGNTMQKTTVRDSFLVLLRIVAVLMIITCHLAQYGSLFILADGLLLLLLDIAGMKYAVFAENALCFCGMMMLSCRRCASSWASLVSIFLTACTLIELLRSISGGRLS